MGRHEAGADAAVVAGPVLVRVAVPVPHLDPLTYRVPEAIPTPPIGARVLVPLGGRTVTGVVCAREVDSGEAPAASVVKPIERVIDADAFVLPDVMALAIWASAYYLAGVGDTLAAALPPGSRSGRRDAHKTARVVSLTPDGAAAVGPNPSRAPLTTAQRRALEVLAMAPAGGMSTAEMARHGVRAHILAPLHRRGFVSFGARRIERSPFDGEVGRDAAEPDLVMSTEQADAVRLLSAWAAAREFRVALLHGVTGSGKSEVYLRLATAVLESGRRSLILVPEIGLTPAMAGRFRTVFGDRVAIQHSGLSAGERHDQWHRIRRGDVDVVVGTRSAVFAPLDSIGLIVVDEEHDPSYKQEETPRYHGRDVAIVRGQQAGAVVVLGSATPSLESYRHAMTGKYAHLVLSHRVLDRPLATVRVVDMREEYAAEGSDVIVSRPLRDALLQREAAGEQAVVLLNRRGLATTVVCRQCANTMDCPRCSVSLVVHGGRSGRHARCHYCDWSVSVPRSCPKCGGPYLELTGFGTERIEAEVRAISPSLRVARIDRDTVGRKGALERVLKAFARREIDVLVGTQMVAKGHDFAGVTLVGVVSADVGLGIADFRAAERTFQLLTQVAGRAGRGARAGEAIIQTLYPEHYSIELACLQDYRAFAERELVFRQEMRYPPFVAMVNIVARAKTESAAWELAGTLASDLRDRRAAGKYEVLGPAAAPLGKLRGEHRVQIFLKGADRRAMREAVSDVMMQRKASRSVLVDVDPVNLL